MLGSCSCVITRTKGANKIAGHWKSIGVLVETIRRYAKVVINPDRRIMLLVVRRALRIEILGVSRRIEQNHHVVRLRAEF